MLPYILEAKVDRFQDEPCVLDSLLYRCSRANLSTELEAVLQDAMHLLVDDRPRPEHTRQTRWSYDWLQCRLRQRLTGIGRFGDGS